MFKMRFLKNGCKISHYLPHTEEKSQILAFFLEIDFMGVFMQTLIINDLIKNKEILPPTSCPFELFFLYLCTKFRGHLCLRRVKTERLKRND